ncbi:BMP family lipoprotein [Hoeflea prorocentri]|uniref:BMP family ABC transporter substrate-binding protein n=1 Tax=Hoeflea prorocentri TaxID=1922333 RepID=A0A9X3UJI8_9HYPH|nr:BMP family ABC transporter substrate-binding protein [Hoeflea prorocentri]MCY6381590.1 BMP family ABC transporter substrate-binding protein [Hoeflea prorocentri]MDA5399390.1 BMP family ABC transporter substrate-binding protein [Hoeflea prorocentri]
MNKLTTGLMALGMAFAGTIGTATAEDKSIVYVSPNPIGNNPFLVMGRDGTKAAAEKHGAKASTIESDTPQAILENLYAAANEGADLIVALSFSAVDPVSEVAPTAPDTQFLIVDACPSGERPDNLHCAVFREHEASFLMGAMAAMQTESGKLGAVSAIDIPFLHRFTDGFADGARHVKPDIEVEVRWVGGQNPFSDPVRAKEQALALQAIGADVIYAAAAAGNFGIYEAAPGEGFKIMGVDANHCDLAGGTMYDAALKRVDQAIMQSVDAIMGGAKQTFASYGLAENGVGGVVLDSDADLATSGCLIADEAETVAKVRAIADQIISGDIKVNDPLSAN